MASLEEQTFVHDDNEFTLQLTGSNTQFTVIAYLGDTPASPPYSVDFETHYDYFIQHKQRLIDNLFTIARSDIEHGMYFRA